MRIEAILFDKDGTLFDFQASWADWLHDLVKELSEGDAGLAARLADTLRFDIAARRFAPDSPVIAGTLEETAAAILHLFPDTAFEDLLARVDSSAAQAQMVPAAPLDPLLERLSLRGLALGVATNASNAEARAHLSAAGIASRFLFVAGCDAGYGAKPGPGMCLAFAEAVGREPARVLMVGDSLHDLKAGRSAGMQTAGVLTGLATEADLRPFADVVLPDIGHLPDWLACRDGSGDGIPAD